MINQGKDPKCQFWCWAVAAIAGVLIFLMLQSVAGKSFIAALILGAIAFVLLGLLFNWLFCAPVPDQSSGSATRTSASTATAAAAVGGAAVATGAASASASSASSSDADAKAAAAKAETDKAAADKAATDKAAAEKAAADKAAADKAAADKAAADKAASEKAATDKAAADKAEADKAAAKKAAADKKAAEKKAATAKAKADKAAADKAAAEAGADYDGDGKLEGENEGSKPELLTAARAGGADDLKRIKGIGPKLEGVCNDMGVYHFDQIAAWTADEMAWVNANLQGFKGRATRDDWVGQAKLLAAGGETEFSKRVDKGSVY